MRLQAVNLLRLCVKLRNVMRSNQRLFVSHYIVQNVLITNVIVSSLVHMQNVKHTAKAKFRNNLLLLGIYLITLAKPTMKQETKKILF